MTGALSLLNAKTRKVLVAQVEDLSAVEFCLVGNSSQAIVVFPDRLVVVKAGTMAGAAFGGRLTEFRYEHIHGIQINTGLVNGTIKIHTAGLGATKAGDFFSSGKEDPFKLPNVIPIAKVNVKHYKPYLELLRGRIGQAPSPSNSGSGAGSPDFVAQLKELAGLRESGLLSPEEFEVAKRKLLE